MKTTNDELHHLVIEVDGEVIVDAQIYNCDIRRDARSERYQVWGLRPGEKRGTYVTTSPVIDLHADLPGDAKFMEGVLW